MIKAILYFDIFKYPLTAEEVWKTASTKTSLPHIQDTLDRLCALSLLASQDGFYALPESIPHIQRRRAGNALADQRLHTAKRNALRIANFPFVQAVMVSGSLSKHYMDPSSDIDYFIVTRPGRLWLARTALVLYKKVFLLNAHRNFCVNYFIDTDHLQIEDQNIFTATETMFLLPIVNAPLYTAFRTANPWADSIYPNFGHRDTTSTAPLRKAWWGRALQTLAAGPLGDRLDAACLRMTLRRWQRKFKDFDPERFEIALRSRKYVSKHHPSDFQQQVLSKLQERIHAFETRHQVCLTSQDQPKSASGA